MGFDVARVVSAFRDVGIDRNGGMDSELSAGQMGDVTNSLLGE
jgi:ubiquitin-conjugating enzyme (huntingtin interacting protein 2)